MAIRRLLTSTITDGIKYNRSSDAVPATGGTVRYANGYFYHIFTSDGTLTANKELSIQVLTVAGGGGGAGSSFQMAAAAAVLVVLLNGQTEV
jgi:hypothetical protein